MSWKLLLKGLVSLSLLLYLLIHTDMLHLCQQLATVAWQNLLYGVLIYWLSQAFSAWRWKMLSLPLGFSLPWRTFCGWYLLGMFLNLFLPGSIGGDAAKVVLLSRHTGRPKREALLTILAERGVGFAVLIALTTLAALWLLPMGFLPQWIAVSLLLLSGLTLVLLLFFLPLLALLRRLWPNTTHPLLTWLHQAKVYWQTPEGQQAMLVAVLLSLLVHGGMLLIHLQAAWALGFHRVDAPILLLTYGLVSLASLFPLSVNGTGIREFLTVFLLGLAGLSSAEALAFSVYVFVIALLASLLGAVPAWRFFRPTRFGWLSSRADASSDNPT